MGSRPLEDLLDVGVPVGLEARVEDRVVEDETLDDRAPLVEPAQRDRNSMRFAVRTSSSPSRNRTR